MNRLRQMFAVVAFVVVGGGTVYTIGVLKPGYTVADAIDAGILPLSVPMQLECRVSIRPVCKRDSGTAYPRYATVRLKARRINAGENAVLLDVPDAPDGSGACLRPVGTIDEACTVLEASACTDPAVCCAACEPQGVVQQCACRLAAGNCFTSNQADGGNPFQAPFGVTLQPGRWQGVGCQRKYCGPVVFGEADDEWPSECP